MWDHARHRGPGKQEFKTEEILSETSPKAWKKMDEVHFESNNGREEIWFKRITAKSLV